MIDLGLKSEYIISLWGTSLTNTYLTSFLVTIILSVLGIIFYFERDNEKSLIVKTVKILIFDMMKLTDKISKNRRLTKQVMPLIATIFLYIAAANILELIPGYLGSFYVATATGKFSLLRSPNSDLSSTLALAIISVAAAQYFSWKTLGWKNYFGRFFNFLNPIKFLLGIFELISELIKILSFSFRLFGNIFAGEVLLIVIAFLTPYFIPIPFMVLEIFVGLIQAFIFAILTLIFIKTARINPANHLVDTEKSDNLSKS